MAQLNLQLITNRSAASLKAAFETPGASAKQSIGNKLDTFLVSLATGTELAQGGTVPPTINISIHEQIVAATGTFTVTSTGSTAAQAGSVAGVALTAVASAPTNNQFVVSSTPTTQAANMAAAINASTTLKGIVTATSALGVVTITAATRGVIGNGIAISAGNLGNVAASGALLTGGAADPTALSLTF